MFQRYDGFRNSVPQKSIDNHLPICPFCGQPAHWLLDFNRKLFSSNTLFMCPHCGGQLAQKSSGIFRLDVLTAVHLGQKNLSNLTINGAYHILTLSDIASNLEQKISDQTIDTSISNQDNAIEHIVDEESGRLKFLGEPRQAYYDNTSTTSITNKQKTIIVTITVISLIVVFFVILFSALSCDPSPINYENYLKVQNGMTYREVKAIFERDGELTLSGGFDDYSLSYYTWENAAGNKIIVVGFANNRVCTKSQVGLRP